MALNLKPKIPFPKPVKIVHSAEYLYIKCITYIETNAERVGMDTLFIMVNRTDITLKPLQVNSVKKHLVLLNILVLLWLKKAR